jgi:hypothetical protein
VGNLKLGAAGVGTGAAGGQGQLRGLYWDGVAVAQVVQRRRAAHWRDASGDSDGDRAEGGAAPAQEGGAEQHGATVPVQRGPGAGGDWTGGCEEDQGDGGSDAEIDQLSGDAQADACMRGQHRRRKPRQFVDRPAEMAELERVLFPGPGQRQRQNTRPAWPRRNRQDAAGGGVCTATPLPIQLGFWLAGRSQDSLKGSVPPGQISEASRRYVADISANIDVVVKDVVAWLGRTVWLLIFVNVDQKYKSQGGGPDAYSVRRYLLCLQAFQVYVLSRNTLRLNYLDITLPLPSRMPTLASHTFRSS